jgi:ATP-binding cassette subfamily B multidrug efflux pump
MKRLLSYLKPHKWVMTLATVLVLFIIAVELYRPIIIGNAIDQYINGYYHPYVEADVSGRYKLERSCIVARPGSI